MKPDHRSLRILADACIVPEIGVLLLHPMHRLCKQSAHLETLLVAHPGFFALPFAPSIILTAGPAAAGPIASGFLGPAVPTAPASAGGSVCTSLYSVASFDASLSLLLPG